MPNTSHSLRRLVKNRVSKAEHIDRLSNLPDTLLLLILSFLPTNFAARTSVLSRRFHLIWEATHQIEDCDPNYLSKDGCALLNRDPSYPLIHLTLRPHEDMTGDELASLLLKVKDRSPDLRHLRIDISAWQIAPVLPIIFSFHNLLSLNFGNRTLFSNMYFRGPFLPSNISLIRLKSLSLRLIESPILSELVSRLYCLEELYLELKYSYNCPILESLKLNHKGPHTIPKSASKPGFRSWLPRNADGNYKHAYFGDLHIGENKKQVIELLNKKIISKKLKIWRFVS